MQTIELAPLGELTERDTKIYKFYSQEISIPYLNNKKLAFYLWGDVEVGEQKDLTIRAITNFLNLTIENRSKDTQELYELYFNYYRDSDFDPIYEEISINPLDSLSAEEKEKVWDYVNPTDIQVVKYSDDDFATIVIFAECKNDWSGGHDLELIYPDGKSLQKIRTLG